MKMMAQAETRRNDELAALAQAEQNKSETRMKEMHEKEAQLRSQLASLEEELETMRARDTDVKAMSRLTEEQVGEAISDIHMALPPEVKAELQQLEVEAHSVLTELMKLRAS